jgi:hypothetical protein
VLAGVAAIVLVSDVARIAAGQQDDHRPAIPEVSAAEWRGDLHVLAAELPKRHPFVFDGLTPTKLTRSEWDSAVKALDVRIPQLSRDQILVGFQHLVALVGAGHTSINPLFDPMLGYHYLPIELYAFRDGIFVRRADSAHAGLVGARVRRIGKLGIDEAMTAVGSVISHENDQLVRELGVEYLAMPEVLVGLGIVDDVNTVSLEVERAGQRSTVMLRPAGVLRPARHDGTTSIDERAWIDMRPAGTPAPLYEQGPGPRWMRLLADQHLLYVAFQSSVPPTDTAESIDKFIERVLATVDSVAPSRLVIDIRNNLGGNSYYNRQLVLGIVRRTQIDQRSKLFVVIGRRTYSAAQNLVDELERYTNATFVGEPTGSPPAFFGEHRPLVLPHSRITVNISTLWWQTMDPTDRRSFVTPQIYAEASSEDYRRGNDPVMDAIVAAVSGPTFATELTGAVESGDTTRALHLIDGFAADPANRYRRAESEVNAIGYDLVRQGRLELAGLVFRLNVRAFPRSANAYDSLGDALERLGQRDEAAAMYRRAIALDSGMISSQLALRRLGRFP